MLYDGDCPLCMREVNMLKKRDKKQNKIFFVDIASKDYSPASNANISYEAVTVMLWSCYNACNTIRHTQVFYLLMIM